MRFAIATALALALASAGAAAETRIGSAAVVNNAVNGVIGTTQRPIKSGDGVFQDETVATGKEADAQLLFVDETTLSIGPESKVVLDKVVFDPDKKTGEVTIRAVSGAFRFVTGAAQKEAYTIKTPTGTIGVRGTIVSFTIVNDILTLHLQEGSAIFCLSPGRCTTLSQPGTYVVVTGDQVSATQVLNALGCGAGKCNEYSYNQGDQTYYIAYFTDHRRPPEGSRVADLVEQCQREYHHHHHRHHHHRHHHRVHHHHQQHHHHHHHRRHHHHRHHTQG